MTRRFLIRAIRVARRFSSNRLIFLPSNYFGVVDVPVVFPLLFLFFSRRQGSELPSSLVFSLPILVLLLCSPCIDRPSVSLVQVPVL